MCKGKIYRGGIYLVNLGKRTGSVQSGIRPCLIIGNAVSCECSPVVLCLPLTSQNKKDLPTHYSLSHDEHSFLWADINTILAEQMTCVDKSQIIRFLGLIQLKDLEKVEQIIKIAVGL